jgi:uncharacterized protein YndB with AHSA1/START domain
MPNIRHELIIEASAEKIYNSITTRDGLSRWWTPGAQATPELNSIARFPFGPAYYKEMKIVELIPTRLVRWTCIKGAEEWIGTIISFQLETGNRESLLQSHPEVSGQIEQQQNDRGSLLIFSHDNWKDYTPMFAECNYTWGRFLVSLKSFCETGKGYPWPNQHRELEIRNLPSENGKRKAET